MGVVVNSEFVQLSARILRVLGAYGPQMAVQVAQRMDPPVLEQRVFQELQRLEDGGWVKLMADGRYVSLDMRYRPRTEKVEAFYERAWLRALDGRKAKLEARH
jgi:hypothetical protein